MQQLQDDPWLWTTDDLITKLCRSSRLFQEAQCTTGTFPDPAALEAQIQDQQITGATLLPLDSDNLRTELKLFNLGHRMALVKVIEFLRLQSATYKQHAATFGVNALFLENSAPSSSAQVPARRSVDAEPGTSKRRKMIHLASISQPAGPISRISQPIEGSESWDHLLHWQQADDEVLGYEDLLGNELLDEECPRSDTDASDEADDDVEEAERVDDSMPTRSKLGNDKIAEIINEEIERFTDTWYLNKGEPKGEEVDYDPEKMWTEAADAGQRTQLIEKYKSEVEYYQYRLDQLCDEIVKVPAINATAIRHQCRNLEVTVNSLQLSEWKLSIYRLDPEEDSEDDVPHQQSPPEGRGKRSQSTQFESMPTRPTQASVVLELGDMSDEPEVIKSLTAMDRPPLPPTHPAQPTGLSNRTDQGSSILQTIEVPPKSSMPSRFPVIRTPIQFSGEPENASIVSIRRWKWEDLINSQDRKRVVSKAVYELNEETREMLRSRIRSVEKRDLVREIPMCLNMLSRGETKIQGVLPRDLPKIIAFTRLFLSWWHCDNYFRHEVGQNQLDGLVACLQEGSPDPGTFCDYLCKIMTTSFGREASEQTEKPSQAEIIEISSDSDEALTQCHRIAR